MVGVIGSIVVAFISDRLRDEDQTTALRRAAYDEFGAAVFDYDEALGEYRIAMIFLVRAVRTFQAGPDAPTARSEWELAKSDVMTRDEAVRDQWTELLKAQNRLNLIATNSAIGAASDLLRVCNDRYRALVNFNDMFGTPDVLTWTVPPELDVLERERTEDSALVETYNRERNEYLSVTESNVRPRD